MSRPIDADRLKRKAQKIATESWKMNITAKIETVLNQFIDWIDDAPTIEQEQEIGRWIIDGHHIECNQCGMSMCNTDREGDPIPRSFCPSCGRKMMEGE